MRAVIDIGSNSVRLMIDRGLKLNPKKLATTRLGGGLVLTGRIDAQAFSDSVRAVAGFCREAAGAGADEIYVFATEAVRAALCGCDLVHIESNHDVRMLENGPYPYYLKRRILADTGHLSNDACAAELAGLAQRGTTRFVLAHLSRENNLPEIAYMTAQAALCGAGMQENVDFLLQVAPRDAQAPVTLF